MYIEAPLPPPPPPFNKNCIEDNNIYVEQKRPNIVSTMIHITATNIYCTNCVIMSHYIIFAPLIYPKRGHFENKVSLIRSNIHSLLHCYGIWESLEKIEK